MDSMVITMRSLLPTVVTALVLLLASLCVVHGVTVKLSITKNGSPLSGYACYYANGTGSCVEMNGTLSIDVPSLPVNVTVMSGGVLYAFTASGNGTVDVASLPYVGTVNCTIPVNGVVVENVQHGININRTLTLRFNGTVGLVFPDKVFGLPAGIYVLKNVTVSGDVRYVESSREVVFYGSGSVDVRYVPLTFYGIPIMFIALGIAILIIIAMVVSRRGTYSSTSRKMFRP